MSQSLPTAGCLFIVATPIGNLKDISTRALETLQHCSAIACEDTRVSQHLLTAFGIQKPLIALHQHNEYRAADSILARLHAGEDIAVISDAGTPLISDPGAIITALAHQNQIRVIPVPGANAVITALSASGFPADRFVFAGFIPAKAGERDRFLTQHGHYPLTTVFYETPHRIKATLDACQQQFSADRKLVIARELTKTFEQIVSTTVADAPSWLNADKQHEKGEFVLLLAGDTEQKTAEHWQTLADDLAEAGLSSKTIAALLAKHCAAHKKTVYNYLIAR